MAAPRSAWRGLGLFWGAVGLAVIGIGGTLQYLGPPGGTPAPDHAEAGHAGPGHAAPSHAEPAHAEAASHPPPPPPGVAPPRTAGPDPALIERTGDMQLPRPGPGGRLPRTVYAAPYAPPPAGTPRVAILLAGFGQSEKDSRTVLDALPGPVSLAVSAYASAPATVYDAARTAGHELLASVPMEPQGYPLNDAGPRSLLTGLSPDENRHNLDWALSRLPGEVGATAASDGMRGETFADMPGAYAPILDEIARRGLLYVDPRPGHSSDRPGLAARTVDVVIEDGASRAEIEARLASLERLARENGSALGLLAQIRPVSVERLAAWTANLKAHGIALVPVSALVNPP